MTNELWQLNGAFWKIPMRIAEELEGSVRIALDVIPLLQIQWEAAEALLTQSGSHRNAERHFWLPLDILQIIATKLPACDPERVLVWNPSESNDDFEALGDDMNAFARSYVKAGCPFPEHIVMGVWQGMCKWAMHSLINLQRPVHMGFCILHPTLLRANWKDYIFSRMSYKRFSELNERMTERSMVGALRCVVTHMLNGSLLAKEQTRKSYWGIRHSAVWSIEVEKCQPFMEQSRITESAKFDQYGKINYWRSVLNTVRIQIPLALRLFAQFIRESMLPNASLPYKYAYGKDQESLAKWISARTKKLISKRLPYDASKYDFIEKYKKTWAENVIARLERESQKENPEDRFIPQQREASPASETGTQGNAVAEAVPGGEAGQSNDESIPVAQGEQENVPIADEILRPMSSL